MLSCPEVPRCPKEVGSFCHTAMLANLAMSSTFFFECQRLQHIRDRYPGSFGQHAGTIVHFMWQADLHGLPNTSQIWPYIMTPTPSGVGHLISPRWLEEL